MTPVRPALFCGALLAALDASEGRRRRRKRDTTPDAIGMSLKRSLLDAAIADDPDPDVFEGWLLERCMKRADAASPGALRAMARDILAEWRLAAASTAFRGWLEAGAPSEDRASLTNRSAGGGGAAAAPAFDFGKDAKRETCLQEIMIHYDPSDAF